MSVTGGGNLYPNWLGSASLTIPNNQIIVNGKVVNLVPIVDLTNHGVTSVAANTKTLVYTLPGTYDAGTYLINAEFQTNNTGGGNTVYATGDSVDWTVQGIGDASPDYAECVYRPYYTCYTDGAGSSSTIGIVKATPSGITGITNNGTQIGIYVKYNTNTAGTITQAQTMTTFTIQKIA
jgi:hypothetical protein